MGPENSSNALGSSKDPELHSEGRRRSSDIAPLTGISAFFRQAPESRSTSLAPAESGTVPSDPRPSEIKPTEPKPGELKPGDMKRDPKEALKKHASVTAVLNGLAAGMTNVLLQPFAVMRTTIQSMNIYSHGISGKRSKVLAILRTFREGGLRTMYRGCTSSVLISSSGWLIFRFFYDTLAACSPFRDTSSTAANLARSGTSSLATSVLLHPFWNAKLAIELQSRQTGLDGWPQYRGALNYVVRTFRQPGGLRASFRGLSVSMSAVSHHTLLIVIYDRLSALRFPEWLGRAEKAQPFLCGMVSRLVPTLLCYPLYVTRVMQQCHNTEVTRFSIFRILFWNYRKHRLRGMYSGLPVQIVRSMLSGGIMFTFYEGLLSLSSRLLYRG